MVWEKVIPGELGARGVRDVAEVWHAVIDDLVNSPAPTDEAPATDLDAIFGRLAKG